MKNNENLTEMQAKFVGHYLADPKRFAGRAARKAGYSQPDQAASRLMRNPAIKRAIDRRVQPLLRRLGATGDRVLQETAALAFANIRDFIRIGADGLPFFDFSKADEVQLKGLAEVTTETQQMAGEAGGEDVTVTQVRVKLGDKLGALTVLAKHLKLIGPNDPAVRKSNFHLVLK